MAESAPLIPHSPYLPPRLSPGDQLLIVSLWIRGQQSSGPEWRESLGTWMNFLYVSSHAADRGAAVEMSVGAMRQSICIDPHLHDWQCPGKDTNSSAGCAVTKGLADRTDSTVFITAVSVVRRGWDATGQLGFLYAWRILSCFFREPNILLWMCGIALAGRLIGLCEQWLLAQSCHFQDSVLVLSRQKCMHICF